MIKLSSELLYSSVFLCIIQYTLGIHLTLYNLVVSIRRCVDTVTGRNTVVDYIRYAQSDDGTSVDPSETDVIFLSLEEGSDVIANPRTMVQ